MRLFAAVIREGSWVQARIDRAIPERAPLPKPDLRMMLSALGPVAVFGAANFPLAFSAGGGDTASALAAGCPVVVKAHPAHPGTCEMVARAILQAARAAGMPDGVYSLIHGASPETGLALARHPAIRAVAFTGSLKAGRALFDAAAARPEPIPVFAEMGSVNPVFLLPRALAERPEAIAQGLCASATLGGGQFCTKPGLIFGIRGESFVRFVQALGAAMAAAPPATMLHHGIAQAYAAGIERLRRTPGVRAIAEGAQPGASKGAHGRAAVFATDIGAYKANPSLAEEVFGPCALAVEGACGGCLRGAMEGLSGQLTISFHAAGDDLAEYADLLATARTKAGRLIVNGYPTGVEVCPSMAHGGPYPASTDSRFTSVGSAAIARFARPVCFQNFPQEALPAELRNINTRGIWRLVDNMLIRGNL